eukprot:3315841-Rhodomonas_salina.4
MSAFGSAQYQMADSCAVPDLHLLKGENPGSITCIRVQCRSGLAVGQCSNEASSVHHSKLQARIGQGMRFQAVDVVV